MPKQRPQIITDTCKNTTNMIFNNTSHRHITTITILAYILEFKCNAGYHVLSQWWKVVHLPQVYLGFLHSLHAGVDGSHQSLLCWALHIKIKTCHLTLRILDWFLNSLVNVCSSIATTTSYTCGFNREENFTGIITSGGMCPRCIWPIVICCWGDGMVPMLSDSAPIEPERITPGSATEPCSTRPIRLNCCWRMVDLQIWCM